MRSKCFDIEKHLLRIFDDFEFYYKNNYIWCRTTLYSSPER